MALCYCCMSEVNAQESVCPHCHHAIPYYPTDRRDLKPGTRLHDDRFEVGRALGHGGFGITYIAYDWHLHAIRTIKEYYPTGCERGMDNHLIVTPEMEETVRKNRMNFLHEARMMSRASDAHIKHVVSIFDQFDENGTSYILMEYLDGKTIDDYMRDVINRPFKWQEAVPLAIEILSALHELHRNNLLHRDISCNNIFILGGKETCLIDFGSAELLDDAQNHPEKLKSSKKPAYTPLEQINRQKQGAYSDVYAMAVVLFKMIAGNVDKNLNGQMLPSLRTVVNDPTIPVELDRILMKATDPDPAKRTQSAAEMAQRLRRLVGDKKKPSPIQLALGTLAVIICLFVGVFLLMPQDTNRFAAPTLTYATTDQVKGNTKTLTGDSTVSLTGTAEAGEKLVLSVSAMSGTEMLISQEVTAEADGRWRCSFQSSELQTPANQTKRYKVSIAYANPDEPPAENDLVLEVNRQFAQLTLQFADSTASNMQVSLGEPVRLSGTAESGQRLAISVKSGQASIDTAYATASDGMWTAVLDTSEWVVRPGKTETYQLSVRYEVVDVGAGSALQLMVRAPQKELILGFEGTAAQELLVTSNEDQIVFAGEATPGESIVLQVGDKTYYPTAADAGGRWYYALPAAQLGAQIGEVTEYAVTASYPDAADGQAAQQLRLVANIAQDDIRVPPTIAIEGTEQSFIRLESADAALKLHGTGAAGAQMNILADDVLLAQVTTDANGAWYLDASAADFRCEPGQAHTFKLEAVDAADDTNRSLQTLRIAVDIPIIYQTPTLSFADGSKAQTLTISETTVLIGTGEPEQRMTLTIGETSAVVTADDSGEWRYEVTLSDSGVGIGETVSMEIGLRYVNQPDVTAAETLMLTVENPMLDRPTIGFYGESATNLTVGVSNTITVIGEAVAGQTLEIYAVDMQWSRQTQAAADGRWNYMLNVSELTQGNSLTEIRLNVRYAAQQSVTAEAPLLLGIDRYAEPIMLSQSQIDDEMTSISGTAEPGASIECRTMDGTLLGKTGVSNDGSFTISELRLTGGSVIQLLETDGYGNTQTVSMTVATLPRDPIVAEGISPGQSIMYGPSSPMAELKGTAAKNKTLRLTLQAEDGTVEAESTVQSDDSGQWQASVQLPDRDGAISIVTVVYQDGKGVSVSWLYQADYYIAPASVEGMNVFSSTTTLTVQTERYGGVSLNDSAWQWDGDGRGYVILDVSQLVQQDSLSIRLADAYGNVSEAVTVPVQVERNRVYGVISRPEQGAEYESDSVISVLADVVSGEAANVSNVRVEVVNAQGQVVSQIFSDDRMTSDQLAKVMENSALSSAQADKGWRVSKREFDKSSLTGGESYTLRLVADVNGIAQELDQVTISYAADSQQQAMSASSTLEGWACGIDERENVFHPASIWFTGYYYADEMLQGLERAELTIYSDRAMTDSVCTKTITLQNKRNLFARNVDGNVLSGLAGFDISTGSSGFVLLFQFEKKEMLSDGTWWAEISFAGNERCTFGPIGLTIDSNAEKITKLKQLTDRYTPEWTN